MCIRDRSQIQDTDAKLEAIMSANSKAQKGQDDYEVANAAWEKYRGASDEIPVSYTHLRKVMSPSLTRGF